MRHTLLLVLLAIAACSASDVATRQTSPQNLAGSAAPAARDGSNFGSGDNPNGVVPVPAGAMGPAMSMDPAQCESGKFCPPSGPDPDNCGTLRLDTDVEVSRQPGNLLILFDQSVSMDEPFGSTTKIAAAQSALKAAVGALQDQLTVGAIFFPTGTCAGNVVIGQAVDPITMPTQIPFQLGPQFLQAFDQHFAMNGILGIGTPLQEAFDRAEVAFQGAKLTGEIAVVLFTDGAPNCTPDPMQTAVPTMAAPQRAASWLMGRNVRTYVVGLPGAAGVQLLTDVASGGGTMQYILPDDPAQLEKRLSELLNQTIKAGLDSCTINLSPAADPVDKLQLVVQEKGMRLRVDHTPSPDSGWTISSDGSHVELTGKLCDDAKAGRFESITFEYGCKDLPILPPDRPL